jgi:hypothetical protein
MSGSKWWYWTVSGRVRQCLAVIGSQAVTVSGSNWKLGIDSDRQ